MGDIYGFYRNWRKQQKENMELQLLQDSFSLDFLNSDSDDEGVIFDESSETEDSKKLALRLALNDYINERIKANAESKKVVSEEDASHS